MQHLSNIYKIDKSNKTAFEKRFGFSTIKNEVSKPYLGAQRK